MFHIKCSFAHWIDESTSLSPQAHQRPSGWQSRNLRRTLSSIRAAETNEPTNLFFLGNHFWSPIHEQESRGNRGNSIREKPLFKIQECCWLIRKLAVFGNIADIWKRGRILQKNKSPYWWISLPQDMIQPPDFWAHVRWILNVFLRVKHSMSMCGRGFILLWTSQTCTSNFMESSSRNACFLMALGNLPRVHQMPSFRSLSSRISVVSKQIYRIRKRHSKWNSAAALEFLRSAGLKRPSWSKSFWLWRKNCKYWKNRHAALHVLFGPWKLWLFFCMISLYIFKMCFFVCKIFVTHCSLSLAAKALLTSVECMLSSPVACSTWHPTLAPFLLYHKYMFFPCMRAIWEFWDRSQNNHAAGSTFFWFKLRCSKTPRFPPAKWWSHLPLPSGNPEGSWGERGLES